MTSSFSFWYVFDRPHWYDMYAFSFWSTFKSVFKSMRFRWKPSAHLSVDGTPERIELYAVSNENALVWTGTLWFLQFACNHEIKSRQVHCSLSLLRLSRLIAPSPAVTNDFSSSFFFLPLDKRKAWKNNTNICVYKNKRISEKRWGNGKKKYWWQVSILRLPAFYLLPATLTTQARTLTAPAINSWSTVRKGRGKQTRENNKKRINGIIITVIITDLCATFR